MEKSVRCKMVLNEITLFPGGAKRYKFTPQYDTAIEEDRRFAKYSPSGEFWIVVDNPAVNYELGKAYYFDSTPAEAAAAA